MWREASVDVAIVGAGLSGLYLADQLHQRYGDTKKILVLEASERIGGRMIVQRSNQVWVDGGAQFIGGSHSRMLKLMQDLNLKTFPAHTEGRFRWCQELWGPFRFSLSPDTSDPAQFEAFRKETEDLAATIPLDAPWEAQNAAKLDNTSFADYLHQSGQPRSVQIPYERLCTMHLGCDPTQISLLYVLFLLHSTGGYRRFVSNPEQPDFAQSAHYWRVDGGAGQIVEQLAVRASQSSTLLWTTAPVQQIHSNSDPQSSVVLKGEDFEVHAQHVVMTVQPQLCERIQFDPPLSESRQKLHHEYLTRQPHAAKTHFIYQQGPFWRQSGYSGTGVASSGVVFVDNSSPDESVGILLAFRDRRRSDLTYEKLTKLAASLFGSQARHPDEILEQDWSTEQWSAACISYTPVGLLSKHGHAIRESCHHGRVHWAGSETASCWPSFMEGALEAANRALEELVAVIQ